MNAIQGIETIASAGAKPREQGGNLVQQAKEIGREISDKATDLAQEAKRVAGNSIGEMQSAASDIAHQARDKVEHAMGDKKSVGAEYLGSLAQSVGRAAGEFEETVPQVATYIRRASDQLQHVAEVVRDRDVRDLIGEVEDFARRQPTLFFGGAVILGFAAARFLKSGASQARNG